MIVSKFTDIIWSAKFFSSAFQKKLRFVLILITISANSYGQDSTTKTPIFSFLNAADFDVNGIGKSNYLGHVNIYKPGEHSVIENWRSPVLGFNVGLMKISYNSDSSIVYRDENVRTSPIRELKVGDQYYRQYNKYDIIVTNTAYSLYAQPTITLYANDNTHDLIMFHLHSELLIFNTKVKSTQTMLLRDTLLFTKKDSMSNKYVSRSNIDDSGASTYKTSKLNGYFGFGFTFDLKVGNTGSFFFQPTVGRTTNFPNFESYLGKGNPRQKNWNSFYLVRAYFTEKLTNNSKIVLGTDIRGLFPRYSPLYSIYAGLSLDIEAVGNLLK